MKHKEILSRAWKILWSYKVLWVFGIILALTTSSGPDRMFNNNNSSTDGSNAGQGSTEEFNWQPGDNFQEKFSEWVEEAVNSGNQVFGEIFPTLADWGMTVITIGILVGCLLLILAIIGWVLRYLSETALIKLVDEYEEQGTKHKIRQGFRIGFSRRAWRMFLANLAITLPTIVAFILLFGIAIAPFLLWMTENTALGIIGTVAGVGLFFLFIFLAIVVGAALSLLKRFIFRAVALDDLGPIEAIQRGYQIVRKNLKDVGLMWLIMVGIGLGFALLLIPIAFLLLALAAVVGGALGLSVGGITSLFATDTQSIIAGAVAGAPIFIVLMIAPLAFLSGLKETYISTAWTLVFREVLVLDALELEAEAIVDVDAARETAVEADEAAPELDDSSHA